MRQLLGQRSLRGAIGIRAIDRAPSSDADAERGDRRHEEQRLAFGGGRHVRNSAPVCDHVRHQAAALIMKIAPNDFARSHTERKFLYCPDDAWLKFHQKSLMTASATSPTS